MQSTKWITRPGWPPGSALPVSEACGEDAGNADGLVFIARTAARTDCTDDVALGILDHDGARLRQEFALRGSCK